MSTTYATVSSRSSGDAIHHHRGPAEVTAAARSVAALVYEYAFPAGITTNADLTVAMQFELPPEEGEDPFRCRQCRAAAEGKAELLVRAAGVLAELVTTPREDQPSVLAVAGRALRAAVAPTDAVSLEEAALRHWRLSVVLREAAELLTRCWPAVEAVADALRDAGHLGSFEVLKLAVGALVDAGRELPWGLRRRVEHEHLLAREAAGDAPWDEGKCGADLASVRLRDRLWCAEDLHLAVLEADTERPLRGADLHDTVNDLCLQLLRPHAGGSGHRQVQCASEVGYVATGPRSRSLVADCTPFDGAHGMDA